MSTTDRTGHDGTIAVPAVLRPALLDAAERELRSVSRDVGETYGRGFGVMADRLRDAFAADVAMHRELLELRDQAEAMGAIEVAR